VQIDNARTLADSVIGKMGDRWRHVQAVAAKAERIAYVLPEQHRGVLVASAWLHDIGYGPAAKATGFHPLDGARFLAESGVNPQIVSLVAYHSGATYEAAERGFSHELAAFDPPADLALLDALTCADMTTGPEGHPTMVVDRIAEILSRYGPEDPVHRAVSRSRPSLIAAVERTEARLAALSISAEVGGGSTL
jgi:predicted hydrolase (HD superfamily)